MARVKIKVERGNGLQQVVTIDTAATEGATIGKNVYNADGTLYVPASGGNANIRNGYGILIQGTNPKTISVNRAADFDWQGQHSWEKPLWAPDGSAAAPAYTFGSDKDAGTYRVGANNYGIATGGVLRWDVNGTRTFQPIRADIADSTASPAQPVTKLNIYDTIAGGGFQFGVQNDGVSDTRLLLGMWEDAARPSAGGLGLGFRWQTVNDGAGRSDLRFYTHDSSSSGTEVYRHVRQSAQMLFALGSASLPTISFIGDGNTGFYSSGADQLDATLGGVINFGLRATQGFVAGAWLTGNGSAGAPSHSFINDQTSGVYRIGASRIGVSLGGTLRWDMQASQFAATVPLFSIIGATGQQPRFEISAVASQYAYFRANANSIAGLEFGYSATGAGFAPATSWIYTAASTPLDFWPAGTLRIRFGTAGQIGIGGATYGSSGDLLSSGGASAAVSWVTRASMTANPSASVGLSAVNGSATTFMRSDAAPALSQSIVPTWTGLHTFTGDVTFSNSAPNNEFRNTSAAANNQRWLQITGTTNMDFYAVNDAASVFALALRMTRSGATIPSMQYGNTTDFTDHEFAGAMHYVDGLQNFVDDAAAAAGGIAVNQLYRNGSVVMIRVS